MSSWRTVKEEALIASKRHCCLCQEFKGLKIEVHHIINRSEGGQNTFENAIPLCFDCHGDMRSYDSKHPKGAKYSRTELKKRRDDFYLLLEQNPNFNAAIQQPISTSRPVEIAPSDKELFSVLRNLDRRNGIISFLRNQSFYSGVDASNLDKIHDFKSDLDISPLYFCDDEMDSLLNNLFNEFDKLSRVLSQKLYPSRSSCNHYEVPKERGEEEFYSDIDDILDCVHTVIYEYDILMRLGVKQRL